MRKVQKRAIEEKRENENPENCEAEADEEEEKECDYEEEQLTQFRWGIWGRRS
jgi:hypothetical protein